MSNDTSPVAALISTSDSADAWAAALKALEFPIPLEIWPNISDPARVAYAIVAKPPPGVLAGFPNLKATLSLWAGVDHVTIDPDWPAHLPLIRMVEDGMTAGMREFVLAQVLATHLQLPDFTRQQQVSHWDDHIRGDYGMEPLTDQRTVGMLGLGVLGSVCGKALALNGFKVMGWSRSAKTIDGIDCRHGAEGLNAVLAESEIVVNLLPSTPETANILNAETFARMPKGAWVINVARGEHVDDAALLAALDSGHLAGAVLDVFRTEPLPKENPYWTHPKVTVTPHIASTTRIRTGAPKIVANLLNLEAGEMPEGRFDVDRGY